MRGFRPMDLVPVVLIAVMGWQVVGSIPFLMERATLRKEIKHRIKEGVPDDERVFFSFSGRAYEQLDWFERDKEFMHDGRMYDIVERTRLADGSVLLECIDDVQETQLFASLERSVRSGMESNNTGRTERCRILNLHTQFHEIVPGAVRWIHLSVDRAWPFHVVPRFRNMSIDVIDPPPRA